MRASTFEVAVCLFLAVAVGVPCAAGQEVPASICQRLALHPAPAWTVSAAWATDGEFLAVVDIASGKILRYGADGRLLDLIARPGLGLLEFNHPTQVLARTDGFLLRDGLGKLLWLDHQLRPLRAVSFAGSDESRLPTSIARILFLDQAVLGDDVLGLGTVIASDGSQNHGFLTLKRGREWRLEIVEPIDPESKAWDYYKLTGPIIAQAAGGVYGLRFEETSFILELTSPGRRLRARPPGLEGLPWLPENRGPATDAMRYAALQRAPVPRALYGRGEYLYELSQAAGGAGRDRWALSQIDPRRDLVLRTILLPSSAAGLVVAPGPEQWAFIEKGPVIGSGRQEIRSMFLVPSNWIEDPAAKAFSNGPKILCE